MLIASYWIFAYAFGWLIGVVFKEIVLKNYYSEGKETSPNHIWVIQGTDTRVRSATQREVYEHYQGRGSWERMQVEGFGCLKRWGGVIFGLFVGLIGLAPGLRWWPIAPAAIITAGIYYVWTRDAALERPKQRSPFELPDGIQKFMDNPFGSILWVLFAYGVPLIVIVSFLVALQQGREPGDVFLWAAGVLLMPLIAIAAALPFAGLARLLDAILDSRKPKKKPLYQGPLGDLIRATSHSGPTGQQAMQQLLTEGHIKAGAELVNVYLTGLDLSNLNLKGICLQQSTLTNCKLNGTNLEGADLFDTKFRRCQFDGASLRGADLREANLSDCSLNEADLSKANLGKIWFFGTVYLNDANLRGAKCREAHMDKTDLRGADLTGAACRGAWLSETRLEGAILRRADLREAHIRNAYLKGADMAGADLRKAGCWESDFTEAKLRGARFHGASLGRARFSEKGLRGARLSRKTTMPDSKRWNPRLHKEEYA